MPIRNQNWYNLQSTRRYPLDDKTTGEDDSGKPIRDDIIVDCHIRYPSTLGKYLFVQGINVTPSLITLIFGVADSLTDTNCPTVAAITVEKPAAANVNNPITSFVDGLSGWIVFGSGIDTNFVGRYSTPMQTFIGLRNAKPYTPLPIPSLGKDNVLEYLEGVVSIVGESPVNATYHPQYTLPKYDPITDTTSVAPVKAIVFSTDAPTSQFNPQTFFLAPCSERPESGTCKKPPIERINGVDPDCNTGNINIVFRNGLNGLLFTDCGGIDILTDRGLAATCVNKTTGGRQGKDDCPCENTDGVSNYCWPTMPEPGTGGEDVLPVECPPLPICVALNTCAECETDAQQPPTEFTIVSGSFSGTTTSAPPFCNTSGPNFSNHGVWMASSAAGMNIALYQACAGDWAYDKTVSVEMRTRSGGLKQNGGVILNYVQVVENGSRKTKYVTVLFDTAGSELQVYSFNGALLVKESGIAVAYTPGHWYRVSAMATGVNGSATIHGSLYDMTAGAQVAQITTSVTDYEVVNGRAGIAANASVTHFNNFGIA